MATERLRPPLPSKWLRPRICNFWTVDGPIQNVENAQTLSQTKQQARSTLADSNGTDWRTKAFHSHTPQLHEYNFRPYTLFFQAHTYSFCNALLLLAQCPWGSSTSLSLDTKLPSLYKRPSSLLGSGGKLKTQTTYTAYKLNRTISRPFTQPFPSHLASIQRRWPAASFERDPASIGVFTLSFFRAPVLFLVQYLVLPQHPARKPSKLAHTVFSFPIFGFPGA